MGRQRIRLEVSGRARIMQIHGIVNSQAAYDAEQRWPLNGPKSSLRKHSPLDCQLGLQFHPCTVVYGALSMCTSWEVPSSSHREAGCELRVSGSQVLISKMGSTPEPICTPLHRKRSTQSHSDEPDRYSPCPRGEYIFM